MLGTEHIQSPSLLGLLNILHPGLDLPLRRESYYFLSMEDGWPFIAAVISYSINGPS